MSTKLIQVRISTDQYSLARRRMWVENITWTKLISALLNAFITGDITVTKEGRYHMSAPLSSVPVLSVPKGGEEVELEPDWNIRGQIRPQVGAHEPKQKPRNLKNWGTREVAIYLREDTGRRISIPVLRELLSVLDIPKGSNSRWSFRGPDDPAIQSIKEAIEEGIYDELLYEGLKKAVELREKKRAEEKELEESKEVTKKARKIKHLKSLRDLEDS